MAVYLEVILTCVAFCAHQVFIIVQYIDLSSLCDKTKTCERAILANNAAVKRDARIKFSANQQAAQ